MVQQLASGRETSRGQTTGRRDSREENAGGTLKVQGRRLLVAHSPRPTGAPGTRSFHTCVTRGANDRLIPRVSRHACSAQKSLHLGQKEERPRRKRLPAPMTVPAIHPQVCGQRKGLPETAALFSRQTVASLLLLKTFLFASKSVSPSCLENSAAELDTAFTRHPGRCDHAAFVRWCSVKSPSLFTCCCVAVRPNST